MRKLKSFFLIHLLFLCFLVLFWDDSTCQPLWISRYNNPAGTQHISTGLTVDNIGNLYVTGTNVVSPGNADVITIKYNPVNGDTVWVKRFGGSANLYDFPAAITTDNAGFVYVTGWFFNPSRDMFVIKYNAVTGDSVWVRTYNGTGNGGDYSYSVVVDLTGNVYITGRSDVGGAQRFTTIKYNSLGAVQWTAIYFPGPPVSGNFDEARMVKVDAAGNVYVTGSSRATASTGSEDYLTLKYNSGGTLQWFNRYNGTLNADDYAIALVLDNVPDVFVTGYSNRTGANFDYVTIKYNGTNGNSLANAIYNGTGSGIDVTTAMTIDNSYNVYITGYSQGAVTNADYATIKYNSGLTPLWTRRTSGTGSDFPSGIAVNSLSEVYVTGSSVTITGYDFFTIKYSSVGDSLAVQSYNGTANGNDYATAIGLDAASNVYVTGSVVFGPPADTDIVTIKYPPPLTIGIRPISSEIPEEYLLSQNYPNPFNPVTKFNFEIPFESFVTIAVYDLLGREVSMILNDRIKPGKYEATWNAAGFPSGVYFYRMFSETFSWTRKMILNK